MDEQFDNAIVTKYWIERDLPDKVKICIDAISFNYMDILIGMRDDPDRSKNDLKEFIVETFKNEHDVYITIGNKQLDAIWDEYIKITK